MTQPAPALLELVDRLAAHRTLSSVPRPQLEWLAAHGTVNRYEAGAVLARKGELVPSLNIVLSGHLAIRVDRGAGPRKAMEWYAGDLTGVLPYSRLSGAPGVTTAEEASELFSVPAEHFPEMAARCFELTAILVHVMLDRARRFNTGDLHDEKMMSLGRLAAGLAHELNNPASAVMRSTRELATRLVEVEASSLALGAARLSPEQLALLAQARVRASAQAPTGLTPIQCADREDALAEWLAAHRVRGEIAETLAETSLAVEDLEPLARALDQDALGMALHSLGVIGRALRLTAEVEAASARIHALVAAIKGFTYMDQTQDKRPVDISRGLADTVAVLSGKARAKSVMLTLRIDDGLPTIEGRGGELNQVWSNLIDNAIDAVSEGGHVEVQATGREHSVVVCVVDDGPGVPEALRDRIFEPFFTTKPQGQGTGLGLDIVLRLVHQHDGQIELSSRPGRTEFSVSLPAT